MAVTTPHVPEVSLAADRAEGDVWLTVFLLLLLTTTVMGPPLQDAGAGAVISAFRLALLGIGVAAIAPQRAFAIAAAVAAVAAAVGQAVDDSLPLTLASRLAFCALITAALLVRVFRRGRITVHRVLGAVSVYVLLAVVWGNAFQLTLALRPEAIRGGSGAASFDEAMWLSFVTITTTGYGDVLPQAPFARSLATLEALVGVLYPAILISRLVSLTPPKAA